MAEDPELLPNADATSSAVVLVRQSRYPRDCVATVEGTRVYEDLHGVPGEPGAYRRFTLRCPCASTGHIDYSADSKSCKVCEKRRNTGPAQTANFGAYEPLGFLGAWAVAAGQFETRDQHIAFKPSKEMVRQYMMAQSWPLDATSL